MPACTLNYQNVFKFYAGDGCLTGVGCVLVLDGDFTWQHVLSFLAWPWVMGQCQWHQCHRGWWQTHLSLPPCKQQVLWSSKLCFLCVKSVRYVNILKTGEPQLITLFFKTNKQTIFNKLVYILLHFWHWEVELSSRSLGILLCLLHFIISPTVPNTVTLCSFDQRKLWNLSSSSALKKLKL